ncbi:MAG: hypothetical protein KDE51_19520, partial [Anaerolineales bacterium]|nr:hypothetical protein [Anaerolineales bacterium]
MSNHSTIQAIETIAQLTDNGLPTFAICLRMTGLPAVWSDPLVGVTAEESAAWQTTIQQVVAPYFEGQSLSAFRPLADQLHQLTETVTITEIVQPSTSAAEGAISRRRLISGLLAEDKPTQPLERVYTETRPLPSTLRYVLSLLLLRSVCTAQHITIRDMLRQEFAWQIDQSLGGFPQLQAAVSDPAVAPLVPELQAIWYTVSPKNTL